MTEGFITIAEAARRLNKSEKTLRRMVHTGKLDARYPVPNRAEVAISDIEALAESRQAVQTENALAERLAQVERKVSELEAKLEKLSAPGAPLPEVRQAARAERPIAAPLPGLPGRSDTDIPDGAVKVSDFVKAHSMSRETVKTQIEAGRIAALSFTNPARPDEQIRYFTRVQQSEAVNLWRLHPRFIACPACPHD